jgi:tuftelin-interacting protein 11
VSELSHNLNLLLEMTEDEIIRDDKRRRYLDDQRVALTHDRASARVAIDAERAGVDRMNACLRLVEE